MDRHPDLTTPAARAFEFSDDGPEPVGAVGPPTRPQPVEPVHERVARWVAWFGLWRLVGTALCAIAVAGAGYWLVRTPSVATEAALPRATVVSVPPDTLSPPVAVIADAIDGPPDARVPSAETVVHVAGEVRAPGVYVLVGVVRVHDAIERAGGPTGDADLDGLNLAALLSDGQRLYVPAVGDVEPGEQISLVPPAGVDDPPAGGRTAGPVDLNRATVAELDRLPGVGPATAQAIVDDRVLHGPFARVDDLERVPGIGPAKLAGLRDLVAV